MRVVIEDPCEHGEAQQHRLNVQGRGETWCTGGSRRVLEPGEFLLIEKLDGEWPDTVMQALGWAGNPHTLDALASLSDPEGEA